MNQMFRKSQILILTISSLAVLHGIANIRAMTGDGVDAESSVCRSLHNAAVRIISGTDRSSGVIVTQLGHVLTVAHGLHGDSGRVTIIFHDGATTEAAILLRDAVTDVAVLQIDASDGILSPIPVSLNDPHTRNAIAFAAGYPGRESNGMSPVLRLGEILASEPQALRSSCSLTSGDSGGPIVNQRGELIGLHRRIGIGRESNLHLPLDHLRLAVLPVLDLTKLGSAVLPDASANSTPVLLTSLPSVGAACQARTVELRHDARHKVPVVLGTLLSDSLVATKLSELTPGLQIQCRMDSGTECSASVVRSDTSLDVAILRLAELQPNVPTLDDPEQEKDAGTGSSCFRLVFAANNADGLRRAGIVSRVVHTEPDLPCRFGAVLNTEIRTKAVIVTDVDPGSAAAAANLVPGELIQSFNGMVVSSLEDADRILKQHQPGDWLTINSFRFPNQHSATVRLHHDPGEQFERSEFLDGRSGRVSERRSGFDGVLQHDIPLAPEECGSPLCDSSGRIVAINIARRARESTLAVPLSEVWKLAKQIQTPAKADND